MTPSREDDGEGDKRPFKRKAGRRSPFHIDNLYDYTGDEKESDLEAESPAPKNTRRGSIVQEETEHTQTPGETHNALPDEEDEGIQHTTSAASHETSQLEALRPSSFHTAAEHQKPREDRGSARRGSGGDAINKSFPEQIHSPEAPSRRLSTKKDPRALELQNETSQLRRASAANAFISQDARGGVAVSRRGSQFTAINNPRDEPALQDATASRRSSGWIPINTPLVTTTTKAIERTSHSTSDTHQRLPTQSEPQAPSGLGDKTSSDIHDDRSLWAELARENGSESEDLYDATPSSQRRMNVGEASHNKRKAIDNEDSERGEDGSPAKKLRTEEPTPKRKATDTGDSSRPAKQSRRGTAPQNPGDDGSASGSSSEAGEKRRVGDGKNNRSSDKSSNNGSGISSSGESRDEEDSTKKSAAPSVVSRPAPKRKATSGGNSHRPIKRGRKTPEVEDENKDSRRKRKGNYGNYEWGTPKKTAEEEFAEMARQAAKPSHRPCTADDETSSGTATATRTTRAVTRAGTQPPTKAPLLSVAEKAATTTKKTTAAPKKKAPANQKTKASNPTATATAAPKPQAASRVTPVAPGGRKKASGTTAVEPAAVGPGRGILVPGSRAGSRGPSNRMKPARAASRPLSRAGSFAPSEPRGRVTRSQSRALVEAEEGEDGRQQLAPLEEEVELEEQPGSVLRSVEELDANLVEERCAAPSESDSLSDPPNDIIERFHDAVENFGHEDVGKDKEKELMQAVGSGNAASYAQMEGGQSVPRLVLAAMPNLTSLPTVLQSGDSISESSEAPRGWEEPPFVQEQDSREETGADESQEAGVKTPGLLTDGAQQSTIALNRLPSATKSRRNFSLRGDPLTKRSKEVFTIFVCGDNGKGQLGLGDQIKREEKPVLHQELKKLKVVDFDCGATHCIALTTNGEVLTWGLGTHDNGALGTMFINAEGTMSRKQEVNLTKEDKMVPRVVDLKHLDPGNITQVAATNDASFALTEDGRVFGWGTFKRLDETMQPYVAGLRRDNQVEHRPIHMAGWRGIKQIAGGGQHILCVDYWKRLWSMGSNLYGQLGLMATRDARANEHQDEQGSLRCRKVESLKDKAKPFKVACGENTSFAIDEKGMLHSWGEDTRGQLGRGTVGLPRRRPEMRTVWYSKGQKAKNVEGVVAVDSGVAHTLACTKDGKIYSWGQFDHGAVGLSQDEVNSDNANIEGETTQLVKRPTEISGCKDIQNVGAGSHHSIIMDEGGAAFTFGLSDTHQTGHVHESRHSMSIDNPYEPEKLRTGGIEKMKVVRAVGGDNFTVFGCVVKRKSGHEAQKRAPAKKKVEPKKPPQRKR